jgi:hypothetical protein
MAGMDDFRDMAQSPRHLRRFERMLLLAAERGDADLVEERLGWGVDPNCSFGRGRTPLIANVRGACPSAATVRALLRHGADHALTDKAGLSALDYARRKLMRLMSRDEAIPPLAAPFEGGGSKSPSLDENGQLALGADEQAEMDRMRAELGDDGGEFVRLYWQERLPAARRVFNDPREVVAIVEMLEEAERRGHAG